MTKIEINDHRKVFAIQKEFQETFPFLKLEFFAKPHKSGDPSPKHLILSPSKTLGECRTEHTKGGLTIQPEMTVANLEQNFRDVYGLSVQVFRKSGDVWLETSTTDNWTLKQQNQTAAEMQV